MNKIKKILLIVLTIVLMSILTSAEPVPRYGAVVIRNDITYGLLDSDAVMLNQVPDPGEPGGITMAGTLSDQLDVILNEFERNVPQVEATAIVSTDGLVIASRLPGQVEEDRVGAMGAA